jgi:hypothetical protein
MPFSKWPFTGQITFPTLGRPPVSSWIAHNLHMEVPWFTETATTPYQYIRRHITQDLNIYIKWCYVRECNSRSVAAVTTAGLSRDPWYLRSVISWIRDILDPWYLGSVISRIRDILDPWYLGSVISWIRDILDPWYLGSAISWDFLTNVSKESIGPIFKCQTMPTGDEYALYLTLECSRAPVYIDSVSAV